MKKTDDNRCEFQLYDLLRRCGHQLYHRSGRRSGQNRILCLLKEQHTISQKELQTLLSIRSGSLSEILEKMENSGLITRSRSDRDRRHVVVTVTGSGLEHIAQAEREREAYILHMFSHMNETEKEELLVLLQKLLATIMEEQS